MGTEMDSLELQVETQAKGANRALSNMEKKLVSIGNALEKIQTSIPSLGKIGDTSALSDLKDTVKGIEQSVGRVNKRTIKPKADRSDLKYVEKDLDAIYDRFSKVGENTKVGDMGVVELQKKIKTTEREVDRLNDRLEKKLETENVSTYGKSYINLVYDIQKATNALEVYRNAMDKIKGSAPKMTIDRGGSDYKPYEQKTVSISKGSGNYDASAMKAVYGTSEIENYSDAVNKLGGNSQLAMQKLNGMNAEMQSDKIGSYETQIAKLKKELSELSKQGFGQGDEKYDTKFKEIALATEKLRQYKTEAKKVAKTEIADSNSSNLQKLTSKLHTATDKLKKFSTGVKKGAKSLLSFTSSCGSLSGILNKPIEALGRLTSKIAGVRNQSKKGMSWGRMVGSSILFSTVFGMISAVKQAIAEGSNNLVQYSNAYNNSISSVVSSLLYLKNAWAVAFSPIVNLVAPYISKFIDMMAGVLNKVGQFFSVLTGKKMAVQAKKAWKDYGATLNTTGASANKAANGIKKAKKAAKEFQTYTLGIDELNVQPKQDKNTSPTSGSGGGSPTGGGGAVASPGISEMFETIKPKKAISDFAKRLREAFLAHDWVKLGAIMAEGVNLGMKKLYDVLDWNKHGKKITYFINAFTTTMNSFVDHIDWNLIGATFANGVNTLVNSYNLLVEGFDFVALGSRVAEAIMSAFTNIDWKNLGRAIGNHFMISWRFFLGLLRNMDFKKVGLSLAAAFNSAISTIDLGMVGETVGRFVSGIITTIRTFIKNADWKAVGKEVMDGVKNAFKYASNGGENNGILAVVLGLSVGSGAFKVIGTITSALESLAPVLGKIGDFGAKIGLLGKKFIGLAPVQTILGKIGSLASVLIGKLTPITSILSKVAGLIASLPTGVLVAGIALAVAGLVDLWNTSATFRDNVAKMVSTIVDAVKEAKTLIWDDTILPLWSSLKQFFASLVTMWNETGMKKRFELIATVIGVVLSSAIASAIKMFGVMFKTVGNVLNGIIKILTGLIKFVTGVFTGNWKLAWSGVKDIVKGFSKVVTSIFSGLYKGILAIFSPIAEWFSRLFKRAYNGIKNAFSKMVSHFRGIWNGIKNIYGNVSGWFGRKFKNAAHAIKEAFSSVKSSLASTANGWLSVIEKAINGIIRGVNWVLAKLGAKKRFTTVSLERISVKKYAKGSSGVPSDTVGMVNDQPGSTYRELIVPPHGKPFIPEGRNVVMPLEKGTKILPAGKTAKLENGIPQFQKGIGDFVSGAWSNLKNIAGDVFDYATHPSKLLQVALNKFVPTNGWSGLIGSIAGGTVKTIFTSAKDYIAKMLKKLGGVGASKAVNWAVNIANDNRHGYDQGSRWGHPDYDCSSLVISAFEKAGIHLKKNGAWTTKNLLGVALRTGFKDITSSVNLGNGNGMRKGDILLKKNHHVALYAGNGKMVHARINEKGTTTGGKPGDQTGKEIMVGSYHNFPWSNILRYSKGFKNGIGKIGKFDFPAFATGGFPEDGMFFANRDELIGKFGGKSAVVNNYQIETGIEEATYRGYLRAQRETNNDSLLREILKAIKDGKSIKIDGREIVRAYDSRKSRNGFSFT